MERRIRLSRWLVLAMVAVILLIALPALAQEAGGEEEAVSVGQVIGALAVFGVIVKTAVQVTRGIFTQLHGPVIAGIAVVYGTIIAVVLDYRAASALLEQASVADVIGRVPVPALDWVITGFAIAAVAGFIAEFAGVSGPKAEANRAIAGTTEPGHPGYETTAAAEDYPSGAEGGHEHTTGAGGHVVQD